MTNNKGLESYATADVPPLKKPANYPEPFASPMASRGKLRSLDIEWVNTR